MKAYALFQEYIWLVNTIHRFGRLTLEEINQRWLDTELSEGIPIARSTFNRHRDAILDMFGIIIECDRKDGFRYYIFNEEVLEEDTIQNWMLSTLSVNSILSESKAVQKRILLESIPSDGDNLHKFIDAMKRGVRVKVNYRRYGAEASKSAMKLDPYFVKLFNKRWYALVKFPEPTAFLFEYALQYAKTHVCNQSQTEELASCCSQKASPRSSLIIFFCLTIGVQIKARLLGINQSIIK